MKYVVAVAGAYKGHVGIWNKLDSKKGRSLVRFDQCVVSKRTDELRDASTSEARNFPVRRKA